MVLFGHEVYQLPLSVRICFLHLDDNFPQHHAKPTTTLFYSGESALLYILTRPKQASYAETGSWRGLPATGNG
jgi:hypothetical protein